MKTHFFLSCSLTTHANKATMLGGQVTSCVGTGKQKMGFPHQQFLCLKKLSLFWYN
uniref:Uncharacterized protein n=1 Tax=Setaria italica TaxID=4555 RepID=K3ZGD9_SETIT